MQAVQVGGKQIAVKAQLLPAGAFFQFLQPHGPFAQQALVDGIDLPAQALACQLDSLAAGFQSVEFLQQLAAGGEGRLGDGRSLKLPLRQKGEIRFFAAQQQGGAAAGGQRRRPFTQHLCHGGALYRRQLADRTVACRADAPGKLPADQGRGALQQCQQRPGKGEIRAGEQPVGGIQGADDGEIQLALRGGIAVFQPRKQRAAFAGGKIHPVQRINDPAVFAHQNQVALPAHELADQAKAGAVAQLVGGFEVQRQHPVQPLLGDGGEPAAAQVLAQQQAEHRRCGGIFDGNGGKVQPRGRPRQNDQPTDGAAAVQMQHHAVPVGLTDLIHAGADHRLQLLLDFMQKTSVKGHGKGSFRLQNGVDAGRRARPRRRAAAKPPPGQSPGRAAKRRGGGAGLRLLRGQRSRSASRSRVASASCSFRSGPGRASTRPVMRRCRRVSTNARYSSASGSTAGDTAPK